MRRYVLFLFLISIISFYIIPNTYATTETTLLWYPYAEWSFDNPEWSEENPFDLQAQAIFTDSRGSSPYLFYDGSDTWKLRYMCTEVGTFEFVTSSTDPDLDGLTGEVICQNNPDGMGPLVSAGSDGKKFYVQGWEKAIIPAWVMMPGPDRYDTYPDIIDQWIENNIRKSGFIGAHNGPTGNEWYEWGCDGSIADCDGENPDPDTFAAYEEMLDMMYQNGAFVHLWAFGDYQSGTLDKFHPKNENPQGGGEYEEQRTRLRHYIADRLGAIPNWMMGEGYDNHEDDDDPRWATYPEDWYNDINNRLEWHHFLGMRVRKNTYDIICDNCNYDSWATVDDPKGNVNYNSFSESYDQADGKPAFEEDRYRYRMFYGEKDLDSVDDQRHFMWWQAMSGGVGAIYGYLFDGTEDIGYSIPEGYPDEWHTQIKAWHDFWYETESDPHRFFPSMERCNDITNNHGLCEVGKYYIFQDEDVETLTFDISNLIGSVHAVAMDTKTGDVIDLGEVDSSYNEFTAPHNSDWVVAIGNFEEQSEPPIISNLRCTTSGGRRVKFEWETIMPSTSRVGFGTYSNDIFYPGYQNYISEDDSGQEYVTYHSISYLTNVIYPPGTKFYYRVQSENEDGDISTFPPIYTDDCECRISPQPTMVIGIPSYVDENKNNKIDVSEVINSFFAWFRGEMTKDELLMVVQSWNKKTIPMQGSVQECNP